MARPEDYPYWATQDEVDPLYNTPNKAVPSAEKQDYGQRVGVNTLRQDINYLFNSIREWIQFFDERYQVGDIFTTTDAAATAGSIGDQLGGTWIARGSNSLGTVTAYVFEKLT